MAAMTRLNRIWQCNTISSASKLKPCKSVVPSILIYSCETGTLLADSEKRTRTFETKRMRKLLCISYLEHKTNDWVRGKIKSLVGPQEPLLPTVKREKLAWFGNVTFHDSLPRIILQGTLEGGRRRDRQKKVLDGQHQIVYILAHTRTPHNGLLQERLEEDLC